MFWSLENGSLELGKLSMNKEILVNNDQLGQNKDYQ